MGQYERLQTSTSAYPDQGHTISYTPASNMQLEVYKASAYNASAAENGVGLFHSVSPPDFKLYKLLAAGDVDFSAEIKAGTAVSIFNTTNNDGCLFQSKEKFNMISFNISQAQTGSPVYTYKYYNGSTFATLALLNTPSYSATGIQVIVFNAPVDWAVGDGTEDGDSTLYSIQVISTTAPSQAVQINALKIGKMLAYNEAVLPGASLEVDFDEQPYLLQVSEAIIPFFSYSNASNRLEIAYKISP
jgi:hypothetical protein